MANDLVTHLEDCTEYRHTLQTRPPRILHGTVILLAGLLVAALIWSAVTRADLVVRAPGRVRPVTSPIKVLSAGRANVVGPGAGGRVVQVYFAEGQEVRRGQVLVRLDTERLDIEIVKTQQTIEAGQKEVERLVQQERLLAQEFEEAKKKAEAELAQALEETAKRQKQRDSDIRLAQSELERARREEAREQYLWRTQATTVLALEEAGLRVKEAGEKLLRAQLGVDERVVEIARRALSLLEKQYAGRQGELVLKRASKAAEVAAAQKDLENLQVERKQAEICAPITGIVTQGDVKVGTILEPGKPVAEIAEQQGFLFEVEVPNEEVALLKVGMPARIKLDSYDYQKYGMLYGEVVFISPDSAGGEGHRASYVIRIKVEGEEIGRGEYRGRVKLGMAGQAEIVTGQESLLALLLKKVRQSISLG
jgi:multidrug efflux pump subunit AcrA (membrane-fusion protein)